ncbi:MAG: glycerol-3-phosphate 1-O-acyltransferase PlsY [Tenericutes bacterium]|nr:glycerol-3-phosphate 1-O-acyltransferase PlsY [Mycoplasmatota bacterium]
MEKYIFILVVYLLGSIPFSYIIGKSFKKEDIRKHGSGNIGTTNAYRVFGKIIGTSVLILDTIKSGLLVFLIKYTGLFDGIEMLHPLFYGFASVLGHIFPVWFKFKGGKGVATSFGLLLAYAPILSVILLPVFFLIQFITKYVSVASCFTTLIVFIIGIFLFFFGKNPDIDLVFLIILFLSTALIFIKHRSNFERIKNHTESKILLSDKLDKLFHKKNSR